MPEINDALQSGCYDYHQDYDDIDWFVDQVTTFLKNYCLS